MTQISIIYVNNKELKEPIPCEFVKNGKSSIHLTIPNKYFKVFNDIFGRNSFIQSTKLKFGLVLKNGSYIKYVMNCKFIKFDQNRINQVELHGKQYISRWLKVSNPKSETFTISLKELYLTDNIGEYSRHLNDRGYGSLNIEPEKSVDILVSSSFLDVRGKCLFNVKESEFDEWVKTVKDKSKKGRCMFYFFSNMEYGTKPSLKVYEN